MDLFSDIDGPRFKNRLITKAVTSGVLVSALSFFAALQTVNSIDSLSLPAKVVVVTLATLGFGAFAVLIAFLLGARDWIAYKLSGNREPSKAVTDGLRLLTVCVVGAPLVGLVLLPIYWRNQAEQKVLQEEEGALTLPPLPQVNGRPPFSLTFDNSLPPQQAYEAFAAHYGAGEVVRVVVPFPPEAALAAEASVWSALRRQIQGPDAHVYAKAQGTTVAAVMAPVKDVEALAKKLGSKATLDADRRQLTLDYAEVKKLLPSP